MIELVDMCSLQDPAHVDFNKMKDSGVRGVYFKSSQYSGSKDPTFDIGVSRATAAGLVCGAYHFAFCGSDADDQMNFFWRAAKGLGGLYNELPPMIDWEYARTDGAGRPLSNQQTVDWLVKAAAEAKRLWSVLPTIYTYPDFARIHQIELAAATELAEYPLTLACYPNLMAPPRPWNRVTVQQYAGNDGRVPGVTGACDRDRFLGSEEEFQAYIGNKDVTVPVVEFSGGIIHKLPGDEQ